MADRKYTLILLPWLKLKSSVTVLRVCFTPYAREQGPVTLQLFSSDIDRILARYRDVEGRPIVECGVGVLDPNDPCKDITDVEASRVNEAIQLFAFAGLAMNEYFSQVGHYTNSSAFQVFFQGFTPGSSNEITFFIRRRDGRTREVGSKQGQVKFSIPIQCAHLEPAHIDLALLEALDQCFKAPDAQTRRLLQAISRFNQAHTDSDAVLPEREIILMASAFEQLFANCNGAKDLACKVSTLLDNYGAVKVGSSVRASAIQLAKGREKKQEQAWFLHRKWVQELYHLRNDFTHGNDPARRSWGWSVPEHLVMASFVFPLLVKVLLAAKSKYSLTQQDAIDPSAPVTDFLRHSTEPDVIRLEVIDRLLDEKNWQDQGGNHTRWSKVIQEHKTNRGRKKAFDQALAMLNMTGRGNMEGK